MNCRGCDGTWLEPVFHMDPMPLAGWFPATQDGAKAADKYPLTWLRCADCGLVNVDPDIPDDLIYRTYSYAASTVPALVRHHKEFARKLVHTYGTSPFRVLEIGGNDGVLLRQLPKSWHKTNVDPSDVAAQAEGDWDTVNESFTSAFTGRFDLVTSSNAFAHFTHIRDAIDGVAKVLRPGGEFWIEVHDLDKTLTSGQWDTVYHEHKVEWSVDSLVHCIEPRGFTLRTVDHLQLHGGLIRARFRRTDYHTGEWKPQPRNFARFQKAYDERRPPALMPHSAAYGAAARASVYLNQMPGLPIDYVVDASPLRAGRFVAGTGHPVLSPDVFDQDRPETTLITAWNHAADIRKRHPNYEGWVAAW